MGGAVVLEAALAAPERVAGLGLLATSAKLGVGPQIFHVLDTQFEAFPEMLGEMGFGPNTPRGRAVRLARAGIGAPQAIVRADFEACSRFDARDRLATIRQPTLVLLGEADRMVPPKHSRFLAERIANAHLVALAETGHMVQVERPLEVANAIEALCALVQSRP